MSEIYLEDGFEKVFIEHIEDLGYTYIPHQEILRDSMKAVLASEILADSLVRINPDISMEVIDQAIYKIKNIDAGLLVNRNEVFFDYLQNGIEVSYYEDDEQKTSTVYLIDYENIENNSFVVTNQLTIIGKDTKRPDIILYINGLPLVVIELKSMTSTNSDIDSAFRQIQNYQYDIENLFVYNAFNIISDFTTTKLGTITAGKAWYKEWKSIDGSYESTQYADYKTLLSGVLRKDRFLDIIKNFIFFEHKDDGTNKILAQYHQYFAVHKAVNSTIDAIKSGDGRGGVFWHTQGSGKSLSMVFYTGCMMRTLTKPTFVILTDRNDLDDQLYGQFARAAKFLRQEPIQASSRENLHKLLNNRTSNGIFFSTMQKFAESEEALTLRDDVIVIADEAHRSQYGMREKMTKDGKIVSGMARLVRKSLPNATYIGFTGTPLSENDKDTQEIFGQYIDVYDMAQAVEDGATKPVYYENRVINLGLNQNILSQIDNKYDELSDHANEMDIEASKRELSRLEQIIGSDEAIDTLVNDIINHYEETRENLLTGKAMVVAYNRQIAVKIYQKILEIRPDWDEKVKVVVTANNNDPIEWKKIIGNNSDKEELAKRFKDDNDPFKIAIVVDMWLTGFDVPSLSTMYVYKPMKGHNLMQAIARVNRVFADKEGGLVVDYIGIASALKEAMSNYTKADQKQIENANIRDSTYPMFKEKLEVCRDVFFYNFNYSIIFSEKIKPSQLANLITEGLNHVLTFSEEKQNSYKREAYALKQAHTLCSSITNEKEQREAAYFEAIRTSLNRITGQGKLNKNEINDQISKLLEQSIHSEGVINLFQDFDKGFSLFDPLFLEKISKMEQKNLSIELLNKLIEDEIRLISRGNIVKGEEFSERLKRIMKSYRESMVDNAESLDKFVGLVKEDKNDYNLGTIREALMKLAEEIVRLEEENKSLGLSKEELAFYHAISKPENIHEFYTNEELISITQKLTEVISKEMTSDWMMRESGIANMRRTIKHLLARHKYPADSRDKIIDLLVEQAEYFDGMVI
ncbi:MAG: type I restriction endonuclease subunit R [Anaerococcus sp.]|uniref:type I restriction endonuclease subunit R n=1 Tax=Anaerococcus TaxID=165779 RepID=UPI0028FDDBB3|nr:type I restriction endonuclease subunit R [Anaerococcus sp.]MDU2353009.1 type I restriction endonuclease subunit R [Anaerococcus sp.]